MYKKRVFLAVMLIIALVGSIGLFAACKTEPKESVITAEEVQTFAYDGNVHNVVATLTEGDGTLKFSPQQGYTDVGEYEITVSVEATEKYKAAEKKVTLRIVNQAFIDFGKELTEVFKVDDGYRINIDVDTALNVKEGDVEKSYTLVAKGNIDVAAKAAEGAKEKSKLFVELKEADKVLFGAYYTEGELYVDVNGRKMHIENISLYNLFGKKDDAAATAEGLDIVGILTDMLGDSIFVNGNSMKLEDGTYAFKFKASEAWKTISENVLIGSVVEGLLNGSGLTMESIQDFLTNNDFTFETAIKVDAAKGITGTVNGIVGKSEYGLTVNSLKVSSNLVADTDVVIDIDKTAFTDMGLINADITGTVDLYNVSADGTETLSSAMEVSLKADLDPMALIYNGYTKQAVEDMGYFHLSLKGTGDKSEASYVQIVFDPKNSGNDNVYVFLKVDAISVPLYLNYSIDELIYFINNGDKSDGGISDGGSGGDGGSGSGGGIDTGAIIEMVPKIIKYASSIIDGVKLEGGVFSFDISKIDVIFDDLMGGHDKNNILGNTVGQLVFNKADLLKVTAIDHGVNTDADYNAYDSLKNIKYVNDDDVKKFKAVEKIDGFDQETNIEIVQGVNLKDYLNNQAGSILFHAVYTDGTGSSSMNAYFASVFGVKQYDANKLGEQEVTVWFNSTAPDNADGFVAEMLNGFGVPYGIVPYTFKINVVPVDENTTITSTSSFYRGQEFFKQLNGKIVAGNTQTDILKSMLTTVTEQGTETVNGKEEEVTYVYYLDKDGNRITDGKGVINAPVGIYYVPVTLGTWTKNIEISVTEYTYNKDAVIRLGDNVAEKLAITISYFDKETGKVVTQDVTDIKGVRIDSSEGNEVHVFNNGIADTEFGDIDYLSGGIMTRVTATYGEHTPLVFTTKVMNVPNTYKVFGRGNVTGDSVLNNEFQLSHTDENGVFTLLNRIKRNEDGTYYFYPSDEDGKPLSDLTVPATVVIRDRDGADVTSQFMTEGKFVNINLSESEGYKIIVSVHDGAVYLEKEFSIERKWSDGEFSTVKTALDNGVTLDGTARIFWNYRFHDLKYTPATDEKAGFYGFDGLPEGATVTVTVKNANDEEITLTDGKLTVPGVNKVAITVVNGENTYTHEYEVTVADTVNATLGGDLSKIKVGDNLSGKITFTVDGVTYYLVLYYSPEIAAQAFMNMWYIAATPDVYGMEVTENTPFGQEAFTIDGFDALAAGAITAGDYSFTMPTLKYNGKVVKLDKNTISFTVPTEYVVTDEIPLNVTVGYKLDGKISFTYKGKKYYLIDMNMGNLAGISTTPDMIGLEEGMTVFPLIPLTDDKGQPFLSMTGFSKKGTYTVRIPDIETTSGDKIRLDNNAFTINVVDAVTTVEGTTFTTADTLSGKISFVYNDVTYYIVNYGGMAVISTDNTGGEAGITTAAAVFTLGGMTVNGDVTLSLAGYSAGEHTIVFDQLTLADNTPFALGSIKITIA